LNGKWPVLDNRKVPARCQGDPKRKKCDQDSAVRSLRFGKNETTRWDFNAKREAENGFRVAKSKTAAGTGRMIPLSRRICACLSLWLERFPEAGPDSFLFPYHKVGMGGNSRQPVLYSIDLTRPMGSWRKAWRIASKAAGVRYRPHDMRHTFISRLAENPGVSEQTIKALAGHVSRQMLERYSHIRSEAKQAAIEALEQQRIEPILRETGHKNGHSGVG
jgi:integrase